MNDRVKLIAYKVLDTVKANSAARKPETKTEANPDASAELRPATTGGSKPEAKVEVRDRVFH